MSEKMSDEARAWLDQNPTAEKFARLFGDDTTAIAMLLHLAFVAKKHPEGDFRAGIEMAIEEAGAWLDGEADDGGTQCQDLMQQIIGLMDGSMIISTRPPGPLGVVI